MPWEKNLSGVTEPTVFLDTGDEAPYNGETEYSINTDKASKTKTQQFFYGFLVFVLSLYCCL